MKTKTIYVAKKLKVPKPFVLPLQIFRSFKTVLFFGLLGKTPTENERALAIGGRLATMLLHALCVFLCTPSLNHNENPLGLRPLLGKKLKTHKMLETKCLNILKTSSRLFAVERIGFRRVPSLEPLFSSYSNSTSNSACRNPPLGRLLRL